MVARAFEPAGPMHAAGHGEMSVWVSWQTSITAPPSPPRQPKMSSSWHERAILHGAADARAVIEPLYIGANLGVTLA